MRCEILRWEILVRASDRSGTPAPIHGSAFDSLATRTCERTRLSRPHPRVLLSVIIPQLQLQEISPVLLLHGIVGSDRGL
jgi:hypothetical protein